MAYDTSQPLDYYEAPNWRLQPLAPVIGDIGRMAQQRAAQKRETEERQKLASMKKPSYKITDAASPFPSDYPHIRTQMDAGIESIYAGKDPIVSNQQLEYIQGKAKAQKLQIEEQQKQLNDLQQTYGTAIEPTTIQKLHNEAIKSDYSKRDEPLNRSGEELSNPINVFNTNTHLRNVFGNDKIFPTQTIDYSNETENGITTTGNKGKVTGRILVDDKTRPIMERDASGNLRQRMSNGQPVYEKRNVQSLDDTEQAADQILMDPTFKNIAVQQAARDNRDAIEKESKSWADSWKDSRGEFPSQEAIDANKAAIAERLAKENVKKTLFQMEKGYTAGSTTKRQDEPRELSEGDKSQMFSVFDMGESGKRYNTKSKGKDGNLIDFAASTYGGVEIKNKKGDYPVITLNEQTVKNALTGEFEKLLGGTKVTVEPTRPGILKANGAVVHVGENETIADLINRTSPEQIRKEGWRIAPITYLTTKGPEQGVADVSLNETELRRYSELEALIKSGDLEPLSDAEKSKLKELEADAKDGTVPKGKGRILDDLRDRNKKLQEYYALDAQSKRKKKTFVVPFEKIAGEVRSSTGTNVTPENIFNKASFRNDVIRDSELIRKKISQPQQQKQSGTTLFVVDGKRYNIPRDKEAEFLQAFPKAKRQ